MLLPTTKTQKTTPKPTINRNFSQVRQYPIKTTAITALGNHHHAPKHAMHNAISGFVSIPSGEARTAFVVIQSVICSTTIAATEASTSGERVKRSGGSLRTSSTTPMIAASTAQPTPYQNKPRVPHTETIAPTITRAVESLPERMLRIGFEIGHLDDEPVGASAGTVAIFAGRALRITRSGARSRRD